MTGHDALSGMSGPLAVVLFLTCSGLAFRYRGRCKCRGREAISAPGQANVGFLIRRWHLYLLCSAMQDLRPGSVDRSLLEESYEFLTRSAVRRFRGKNTLGPDIILKLGDHTLPAHRSLLAASSDVFKAMFQASSWAGIEEAAI